MTKTPIKKTSSRVIRSMPVQEVSPGGSGAFARYLLELMPNALQCGISGITQRRFTMSKRAFLTIVLISVATLRLPIKKPKPKNAQASAKEQWLNRLRSLPVPDDRPKK